MFRSTNAPILAALAVVVAAWAFAPPALCASTVSKAVVRQATRGPFAIGWQPRKVTVEITTTTSTGRDDAEVWRDSFVVRDRRGKALLRRDDSATDPVDLGGDMNVVPNVVPLPDGGAALLIMRQFSPSAPGTGVDGQLFGFSMEGRLVPITGVVSPDLNDTDASAFHVTRFETDGASPLVLEVEEWANNFTVLRHYPIDSEGVQDDDAVALEEKRYGIRIDGREAAGRREDSELEPVVTLRSAPRWDAPGEPCGFDRSSTIEFLDAAREDGHWWIHVRINGREGYVSNSLGDFDLDRLGLESAG